MRGIVAERDQHGRVWTDRIVRRAAISATCAVTLALSGCYVMQAATGQLDVMARSRPISRVIHDPATPPATRERLELAIEARRYAVHELGLPDNGSYRRYVDLGRPYVVWNVVATPEFSLRPLRWCFLVAGCVSYRGYFNERDAQDFAWKLAARGDDTVVEGVAAYSTLGHFADPVFSTMLAWGTARIVGTIFHELAHQRLYVPGDSAFNEAFAGVVEDAGLRRWLESRGAPGELAAYELARRRHEQFLALLRGTADRLERLYAEPLPADAKRLRKIQDFGRLVFEYGLLRERWAGYGGYDAWFTLPLNNANLASVSTYRVCVPGLERELAAAGSLTAFYARAEALAKLGTRERHAAVCGK
jgi:predicted aminopeptidase